MDLKEKLFLIIGNQYKITFCLSFLFLNFVTVHRSIPQEKFKRNVVEVKH